jgi:aminoacrylate hydrolase
MVSRITAILRFDVSEQLAQITAPTLVVCARDDLLTPAYFSESIAAAIPGSELMLTDSGGHAYSRCHPVAFNELLTRFIGKQPMTAIAGAGSSTRTQ